MGHSAGHSTGRVNSAKRSPELSISLPELNASLPMDRSAGRSTGRVNSAKRFLRKRFRVDKLRLRTICCITFLACNLLTRAESPDSPRRFYVELTLDSKTYNSEKRLK